MDNGTDNGNPTVQPIRVEQHITVKCNPVTMAISIDMDCASMDLALSLLERAHRELETRFRFQRAQELQLEAISNARMAQVAGDVMKGKLRA